MHTRQDYMDKKCTHQEYYSQFVDYDVIIAVLEYIGEKNIIKSKDEHFNDIPLKKWDNLGLLNLELLKKHNETPSLATNCCIGKAAARMIKIIGSTKLLAAMKK